MRKTNLRHVVLSTMVHPDCRISVCKEGLAQFNVLHLTPASDYLNLLSSSYLVQIFFFAFVVGYSL